MYILLLYHLCISTFLTTILWKG